MKTSTIVWVVVVIVVLLGGGYFLSSPSDNNESVKAPSSNTGLNGSPDQTNTGQSSVAPVLTVVNSPTLGDYLVASNGMTLYLYTKDTAGVSNCAGTCAVNWPPYTHDVAEPLVGGGGVTGAIDTIARADGGKQITYQGVPLYFWKSDAKPGDTTGQNVGGVWFVVKP